MVLAGESPTNPLCSITIKAKKRLTATEEPKKGKKGEEVYSILDLSTSHMSKMGCIHFNNRE
jgi:hypothetical protein